LLVASTRPVHQAHRRPRPAGVTPGDPPAGTVTMLFTEDSAALLSRLMGLPDTN
jgi:hypothetical protein